MSSRELEEKQEERLQKKIARDLGISYDELCKTEFEIHENASDDGLVYSYYLIFSNESPHEILEKIGVNERNEIELGPGLYDDDSEV